MKTGVALLLALTLLLAAAGPASADTIYTVQRGDTLYRIAVRFGVTTAALVQANGLRNPNLIYAGQQLIIPDGGSPPAPTPSTPPSTYTVQRGDTLWAIGRRFGVSVAALMAANRLTTTRIYAGQVLVVPGSAPVPTAPPPASTARVVSFTLAPGGPLKPGDPVTLRWETTAPAATLCALRPHGVPYVGECQTVPGSGSLRTQTINRQRYQARYSLQVQPAAGAAGYAEVSVPLTCPDAWAFANRPLQPTGWDCPASPLKTVFGAAERFERGAMYWLSGVNVILVRTGSQAQHVPNTWQESMPVWDRDIIPPHGFFQPLRGFGWVWRGNSTLGDVRGQLGWALEAEYAHTFSYQCNAAPDVRQEYCLIQTPHGLQVWHQLGWEVAP